MRILSIAFLMACAPGSAVTAEKVLDDDVAVDSGVEDTANPTEPSGEPSDEPSGEPSTEPSSEPATEPSSEPDPLDVDNDGDGFSENDGDCNDADALINPEAQETVDDGIDQDCNGADLSCDTTVETEWVVDFPATGTGSCDWGNAGNLAANDGVLSARRAQEARYVPPSNSAICAIRPAIQSNQGGVFTTFDFDDAVLMVYNDYVLFSTNDELIDPLQDGNWNGKLYDWDLMKGEATIYQPFPWEWGNSIATVAPGVFNVSMQNGKMNNLHDISIANGEIRFMLVTFGDNDNDGDGDGADCYHDGLSFSVEIDLAQ